MWRKGAYINGSANELTRQNISSASQKEVLFLWLKTSSLLLADFGKSNNSNEMSYEEKTKVCPAQKFFI
ncbi:hypothetical protein IO89_20095 [Epilithonimonas lactis]|uniref:Uncharacterized protein n=1 Tax=Epilithonimonas lactis TaxID=421072 RepID=A0A085B5W1_9FLAO|nr:hypothetical protein IO89_20095 [Epilithonimonas lactis]